MYINADVGESIQDKEFLPFLDIANIACGGHAGDESSMQQRIQLAKQYGVKISAHISYQDKENFGRKSLFSSPAELKFQLLKQLQTLDKICTKNNYPLTYVKPHGALYNDTIKNKLVLRSVAEVITAYNSNLQWIFFANKRNEEHQKIVNKYGIKLCFEAFADRKYEKGLLMDRKKTGAVIKDSDEIIRRFFLLQKQGMIVNERGLLENILAQTVCFHGDNSTSLQAIKTLSSQK